MGAGRLERAVRLDPAAMSTINDIYADGIASGWKLINAATLTESRTFEADVVIVGSGAGGGTAAEILVEAGLTVLMLEEGALYTAADFKDMDEWRGYTTLYQEGGGRSTHYELVL